MTQQYLIIINDKNLSGNCKKPPMIKTYSFTTDDDDGGSISKSQLISNHDKLLALNTPSIDSHNNYEDDSSENSKNLRKRKSRRQTELENHIEKKSLPISIKYPWYKKLNLSKPLTFIILIILIYLMWIKRDIWIQRLLTSNVRNRGRSIIIKDDSIIDSTNSSQKEDIIVNINEKNDVENNNNNEEDIKISSIKNEKINLKIRRNKMNFNQENSKKKKQHHSSSSSQDSSTNNNNKKEGEDQLILPSLTSSTTINHHQHRSIISRKNSTIHFSTYNDIIKQLRKNLKSRSYKRNYLSKLSKITGLNKRQLYRFIYKKNHRLITLKTFITLLDSFHSILLIVPK